MPYTINKSDGTILVEIPDGNIDKDTTSLTLIGKNSITFGEALNENLIFLLENFSSSASPRNPVIGQLWYDTIQSKLKIYTGLTGNWKAAGSPIVSPEVPNDPKEGDLWIDSKEQQLYFHNGSELTLAGPIWKKSQGKTGFIADTIYDAAGNAYSVLYLYVNSSLLGIYSSSEFVTSNETISAAFPIIQKGYTSSQAVSTTFDITSIDSEKLGGYTSDSYLRRDIASTMNAKLTVASNLGITIGTNSNVDLNISGNTLQVKNNILDGNVSIQTTNVDGVRNNIFVNASSGFVGIFTNNPQRTFDVNGNSRIIGTLEVNNTLTVNNGLLISGNAIPATEYLRIINGPSTGITGFSGTITSTSLTTTITGLSDTSAISEGMTVTKSSGSGVFGGITTVKTVDSPTQITILSTTANTTGTIIFTVTPITKFLIDTSSGNTTIQGTLTVNKGTTLTSTLTVVGKTLLKPIPLTFVDNGVVPGNTILLLNDIANSSNYLNGQEAIVHHQTINFVAQTVTRYLKLFRVIDGNWVFVEDLTGSV